MKKAQAASGTGRSSRRHSILFAALTVLAVIWVATIPWRSRVRQETARLEQDAAAKEAETQRLRSLSRREEEARGMVSRAPESLEARLALSSVLAEQRNYPEAIENLRAAARIQPRSAPVRTALGELLDVAGMPDLAIVELRRALELDPHDVRAATRLAYKYVSFGWNYEAQRLLRRMARERPEDPRLHIGLGLVYFQNNDYAAAERELLTARRLAPDDPKVIGPLIEVYRHSQRYPQALQTIAEALQKLPDKGLLMLERANVYLQMENPEEALRAANDALALHPNSLDARYVRGVALKMQGKTEEAIQELEHVRARSPGLQQTLLHLGQLYVRKGDSELGRKILDEHKTYKRRSDLLSRLTLRVALKPNDADAHIELARAFHRDGSLARAIVQYKRALEIRPGDFAARKLLAKALTEANRPQEAAALGI